MAAEGLLIYLPPEAQDRLFDDITALSAPGSTVATEYVPGITRLRCRQGPRACRRRCANSACDIDMPNLVYAGERSHVMEYLREQGWQVTGSPRDELFVRYGLDVPADRGRCGA